MPYAQCRPVLNHCGCSARTSDAAACRRKLIVKSLGILGGVEIAVRLAPVSPATDKPMNNLSRGLFRAGDCFRRPASRFGFPSVSSLGHTGFAEIFAHHDVGGELTPRLGNHRIVHLENDRAVGIRNATGAFFKIDGGVNILTRPGLVKRREIFIWMRPSVIR